MCISGVNRANCDTNANIEIGHCYIHQIDYVRYIEKLLFANI